MHITSPEMLANFVHEIRKKSAKSQREVAELVGIKQVTLSSFENKPEATKVATLFKLLSALGLELHIEKCGEKPSKWNKEW